MSTILPSAGNFYANLHADRTKRSSNFSIKEVKLLLQLVDDRKEVIESKKVDRTSSEEKIKAWMEIEEKFNAVFDDYRSFKVLKTKYDNLKKNFKRKMPPNISNLNVLKVMRSTDNLVLNEPLSDGDYDMSEEENTLDNSNASDVDKKPIPTFNEEELDAAAEEYVFETLLFGGTPSSAPIVEQNTTPKPVQEQPTKPAVERKKYPTVDVWEEVAHKKLKKLELEIKVMGEEWEFRKQKLELEVEGVRIENKFKEERLKLELDILKQKLQNNNK